MAENMLWQPSNEAIKQTNITQFIEQINKLHHLNVRNFADLYDFSIRQPEHFWTALWSFCEIKAEQQGERFILDQNNIEKTKFFPDARLNYAENLLRRRDNAIAITFYGEDKIQQNLTFQELYQHTATIANKFREYHIQPGDRIVGYLPNLPQTVVAMLAATSIGAVWSSCSPDFGIQGVIDRFSQISPKVLIITDGYYYGGKSFSCLERLEPILEQIPSIQHVIIIPYLRDSNESYSPKIKIPCENWTTILNDQKVEELEFVQLPFNHPLLIMFSSGTTGVPKCIVHGAGGTLLQHLKEHQLHCDIKPDDKVFYYTTCGWMMWNWLVSALASRASLVLYDGSPLYPHAEVLFDIAEREKITLFGTSAKYIDSLAKIGCKPIQNYSLPDLRMITSTGSPLAPESFDYVYQYIKTDVCLASISGGTDIISCFVLGNPIGPVWSGEAQVRGLGLAVEVYDADGKPIIGEKGELVCTQPFPSQPLGFWNDPTGEKYHASYYARFQGVWHHGDFVELTPHGGMIIYGRSDSVLNPGGVRIGTAEIYRQVEQIPEVLESIAVGQSWENDERIILFVHLKEGLTLTDELLKRIKHHIKQNTTPRHVPAKIISVTDIPRTKNGKLAEHAVRDSIHGKAVTNKETLANPEALEQYKNRAELDSI
jgi:acetoacetyl-CoA synthetase